VGILKFPKLGLQQLWGPITLSSQNENIMNNNDEIYLNDVVMEEKKWKKKFEI
jgi:hypothetical protein